MDYGNRYQLSTRRWTHIAVTHEPAAHFGGGSRVSLWADRDIKHERNETVFFQLLVEQK